MKPTGINTADITSVIAIIAPPISPIAFFVAFNGGSFSLCIFTWTASTTTIALSTTIPIASTKANKVSILIEKPSICIKKNVPINDTGTAIAGISVDRKSCKKRYTTTNTKINASSKVLSTTDMEASKKRDTSYEILYSIPGANVVSFNSSIFALICWITSRAFEPGRCLIMIEAEGFPSVMEIIL